MDCTDGEITGLAEVGQVCLVPEGGLEFQEALTASDVCCSFNWQGAFISHLQGKVVGWGVAQVAQRLR